MQPTVRFTKRSIVSLAVGAGLAFTALPATAAHAATTECVGILGAITVQGDVVVPAEQWCDLDGARISGTVTVGRGSDLMARNTRIGSLTLQREAFADLINSRVNGDVVLRTSQGLFTERSSVQGEIDSARAGWIYLFDSSVDGDVRVRRFTEFTAEFSDFDGRLVGTDVGYFDVFDSTAEGPLRVVDAEQGGYLCTSKLEGTAVYKDNDDVVQVGGEGVVGSGCGGNLIEGNLRVLDAEADTLISNNVIDGNLNCRYNEGALYGEGNQVWGQMRGQCSALVPPASAAAAVSASNDRRAANRAAAEERAAERLKRH